MAYFTITLVALVFIASFVFSFAAIADTAEWTGAPPWTRWLAPIFIDGAILTYTCSLAIVRHRGESPVRSLFFLYTFTGISVAVNFAHAGAAWDWDFSRLETWFGSLIGVAAPLAALFAADEATRLVFTRGDEPATETEEPSPAAGQQQTATGSSAEAAVAPETAEEPAGDSLVEEQTEREAVEAAAPHAEPEPAPKPIAMQAPETAEPADVGTGPMSEPVRALPVPVESSDYVAIGTQPQGWILDPNGNLLDKEQAS